MIVRETCSLPDEQRSIVRTPAGSCTRGREARWRRQDAARRSIPETRACSPKTSPGPMTAHVLDVSLAGHGLDQGMAGLQQKQPVTALTLPAHELTPSMRRREQSFRTSRPSLGDRSARIGHSIWPREYVGAGCPRGLHSHVAAINGGSARRMLPMATLPRGPARGGGGPHGQLRGRRPGRNLRRVMGRLVCWCAEGIQRAREGAATHDDVRRAAESFRRHRKLEAGEDLRSWLAARAITMSEWESHLRRAVVLGGPTLSPSRPPRMPAEFEIALRVDSFCRGFWESESRRVLSWLAAAELVRRPWYRPRTEIDQLAEPTVDDDTTELGAWERIGGASAWPP